MLLCCGFFFFQAEDGIRDHCVTGVQTCALPILEAEIEEVHADIDEQAARFVIAALPAAVVPGPSKIGRASCRERV